MRGHNGLADAGRELGGVGGDGIEGRGDYREGEGVGVGEDVEGVEGAEDVEGLEAGEDGATDAEMG